MPGETGEDFQEEDFQEEVDNEDKVDNEDNEEDEINEYPSDLDNEYPDSDYYDEDQILIGLMTIQIVI